MHTNIVIDININMEFGHEHGHGHGGMPKNASSIHLILKYCLILLKQFLCYDVKGTRMFVIESMYTYLSSCIYISVYVAFV